MTPVRVLHFVTGGFSGGAPPVAGPLGHAAREGAAMPGPRHGLERWVLVPRRRRHADPSRIVELRNAGVPLELVAGWSHAATISALVSVCKRFKPDVLVAHGFSEHLWGRYAGLLAKVPHLVHVEHNTRERYTAWRRAQARWLARRTDRIVGCSEGVRQALLAMGMPAERTIAIPNGVRLEPFADADAHPFAQRIPGIVMVARFSKQKDHATVLRALALLRARGLSPSLLFAGGGKDLHRKPLERLADELGIAAQVRFLGVVRNVPELLMTHQLAVLGTHYEGMPLALLEGMAAGCAVVGSAVPGVREVLEDGVDGLLVAESDPVAMADALERVLRDPGRAARMAATARQVALQRHGRALMNRRYEDLFLSLAGRG